jgi:co-chaperonin GroES (HSP10)
MRRYSKVGEVDREIDPANIGLSKGLAMVKRKPKQERKDGIILLEKTGRKEVLEGTLTVVGPESPEDVADVVGKDVCLHGHANPLFSFKWEGAIYDLFQAEDIMATVEKV